MRITILIIILCTAGGPSSAQALTVEEAVATALRANPVAREAEHRIRAARAAVDSGRALSNPTLTVAPTILGPEGSDEVLAVTQPLEVSGTRGARESLARAGLRATEARARGALRDLAREVRYAYVDLSRAHSVLGLQKESLEAASRFEQIAGRQVELGSRPGIDLTQLRIERTRARQAELLARNEVRVATAALNTLMGRPPESPIDAVTPLQFTASPGDVMPDTEGAISRRDEVGAEVAAGEAAGQRARLLRAEGRPDVALQGRLESFTDSPRVGGVAVSVTIPLFDYGSRRSRIREAEEESLAQASRVEAARGQVRLEIAQATARLQSAEQLVRVYEEGLLDDARRLADAERTRFSSGAGGPLTVLEAQRTYRAILSDYYAAIAAHARAKAELAWALGEPEPNPAASERATFRTRGGVLTGKDPR